MLTTYIVNQEQGRVINNLGKKSEFTLSTKKNCKHVKELNTKKK